MGEADWLLGDALLVGLLVVVGDGLLVVVGDGLLVVVGDALDGLLVVLGDALLAGGALLVVLPVLP